MYLRRKQFNLGAHVYDMLILYYVIVLINILNNENFICNFPSPTLSGSASIVVVNQFVAKR